MKIVVATALLFTVVFSALELNANAQEDPFVISPRAVWKYHASTDAPGADWATPAFDDSGWKQGLPGFGYGDDDDTTILDDMRGNYDKVYIRHAFEITSEPQHLFLFMHYDDAFKAYINGKEVESVGVRADDDIAGHEAEGFETFRINRKHFVTGSNLIAIEGFNTSLDSSDFSLWPVLAKSRDAMKQ